MLNSYLTRKEQLILLFIAVALVAGGIVLYARSGSGVPEPAEMASPRQEASEAASAVPLPSQEVSRESASAAEAPTPAHAMPASLRVAVRGAVYSPGLYTFDAATDPRVEDLLRKAGGLEDYADVSDINVAARLIDGTTLTVPGEKPQELSGPARIRREPPPYVPNPPQYTVSGWRPETPPPSAAADQGGAVPRTSSEGLININTATQAELETLPGIGPVYAARIIAYREHSPFQTVDELINISGIGDKRLASIRPLVTVR